MGGFPSPSASDVVKYVKCVLCGCVLNDENRSEYLNLCCECLRGLQR
jgi:hypothetical protein